MFLQAVISAFFIGNISARPIHFTRLCYEKYYTTIDFSDDISLEQFKDEVFLDLTINNHLK